MAPKKEAERQGGKEITARKTRKEVQAKPSAAAAAPARPRPPPPSAASAQEQETTTMSGEVIAPDGRVYESDGVSLLCLKPKMFPRSAAIALVCAPWFETLILVVITLNVCSMAWESPMDEEGTWKAGVIALLEVIFLGVYTVEMLVKMLAYGIIGSKSAYLHDPWCILDFTVVSCAWAPILMTGVELPNVNSLRALRAFRALRAMKIIPGLRVIVEGIMDVIPKLGNVVMLFIFVFVVFGIIGMELFQGTLHYRCALEGFAHAKTKRGFDEAEFDTEVACNPDRDVSDFCEVGQTCAYFEGMPFNGMMSYDSVLMASITLMQTTTWDTWEISMFALMDYTGSAWVVLYYLIVIIIAACFVKNLFLAVLFEEFTQLGRVDLAVAAMEKRQQQIDEAAASQKLPTKKGAQPGFLETVANSSILANSSIALVLLNMVLMSMPYYGMSDEYAASLEFAGLCITCLFALEMGVKLLGLGCSGYWSDNWNVLDGTIVLLSLFEILVTEVLTIFADGSVPQLSFLRMLRLLRIARALRLMRSWQGLYKIVRTLISVIPKIASLALITFLFMVIFVIAGMQFFGGIFTEEYGYSEVPCHEDQCPNPDLEERPHFCNFDYFFPGLLSVFILFTGEWVDSSLAAASIYGPKVLFYFLPCMCVGSFLIMNIFIGMVLSAFGEEDEEVPGEEAAPKEEPPMPKSKSKTNLLVEKPWPQEHALCLFGPRNGIRRSCEALVSHKLFEQFILLVILASSVSLAMDSPLLDPSSATAALLTSTNYIFTAIFVAEMLLKIIAYGFAFTERAYLKEGWNQLDFFIVVISVAVIAAEVLDIPALAPLTSLRVLRALRPLRLIGRIESMKLIVATLIRSIPAVVNVALVFLFIQAVFAILAMQLFAGTFAECSEDHTIKGKHHCEAKGYTWENPVGNSYDDFGQAMLSLFLQTSGDLWETEMFQAMASTSPGHAPVRNDFSLACLFTIVWMFVGAFIALNLFVGAIVDTFNSISAETGVGSATMTGSQLQWVQTVKATVKTKPAKGVRAPEGGLRLWVFNMITHVNFDIFIITIILLNTGLMACKYYGYEEDAGAYAFYNHGMRFFTTVYYTEFLLKIFALGPFGYFSVGWNRFDFTLVLFAFVDDVTHDLSSLLPVPPFLLRVMRLLRIVRILRILKGVKGLRDLVTTIILSLPPVFNVCSLLALVMFIYAVLGMHLFGFLALQENIESHVNFQTVGNGMLLLLQAVTGDGWTLLMQDARVREHPDPALTVCTAEEGNCGSFLAVPYFLSFQLIGTLVFMNLMIAVILDNFSTLSEQNPDLVSPIDIDGFMEAWAELDPEANNSIQSYLVPQLIGMVAPPLGVMGEEDPETKAKALARKLKVTVNKSGEVKFADVLLALSMKRYLDKSDLAETELIKLNKDVEQELTEAEKKTAEEDYTA
jgi:hypothetical protein